MPDLEVADLWYRGLGGMRSLGGMVGLVNAQHFEW